MLSQDPYPFGQAMGLAFSSVGEETPYSLRMIFRELDRDIIKTKDYKEFKQEFPTNDLSTWAKRGVLLLNTVLTVRSGLTGSHSHLGWQQFTGEMLRQLWEDNNPKVFVLWGSEAQKALVAIQPKIEGTPHLVLEGGHPASGSHGKDKYSGNSHFSKINHWFKKQGIPEINWRLSGS